MNTMGRWAAEALCSQVDVGDVFYPQGHGSNPNAAKAICRRCPVTAECLEYALTNDVAWGVWGGLAHRERRKLQRRRMGGAA